MRQRILLAAAHVLREQGFAETTTKEIARVASVSEGSIYNHFPSKTALIAATMAELTSGIREAMARLLGQAGQNSVAENLTEIVEAQIHFLAELLPITGPTLGNHQLRNWLREGGPSPGAAVPAGPVLGHAGLIAYLEAEQRAGRLDAEGKPPYLAAALIGAALEYAFLTLLTRSDVVATVARLPDDATEYARDVVQTVLAGHQRKRTRG
jgi:AcrR family transcriptional regulator